MKPLLNPTTFCLRRLARANHPSQQNYSLRILQTIPPRSISTSTRMDAKFAPAARVAGQKQDVWSIINEAAAASPKQPIGWYRDMHSPIIFTDCCSEHGPRVFVSTGHEAIVSGISS